MKFFRPNVLTAAFALFLVAAAGCASPADLRAGTKVAVFGGSQRQLRHMVEAAQRAHLHPVFVSISAAHRRYDFPVLAQVARSSRALLVRGYGGIYVFPLHRVSVAYDGQVISERALPRAAGDAIDASILRNDRPEGFMSPAGYMREDTALKAVCPDCFEIVPAASAPASLASAWNGAVDPWQSSADYVLWDPRTSKRRLLLAQRCRMPGGDSRLDASGETADTIDDPLLSSLEASLISRNLIVPIVVHSDSSDTVALSSVHADYAHPQLSRIDWNVPAFEASGDDPNQILFHQLDALWYAFGPLAVSDPAAPRLPSIATVTIAGRSYRYSVRPIRCSGDSSHYCMSSGYDGLLHMLVHRDLLDRYGYDDTPALREGLRDSGDPPADLDAAAKAGRDLQPRFSFSVAAPPAHAFCTRVDGTQNAITAVQDLASHEFAV